MYILLSGILAVIVTSSAVRCTMISFPAVVAAAAAVDDVRCSLYPNIHFLV
jgi:hypothetical protein